VDRTPGDDEALLALAVGGDSEALGELLTRSESRVRGLLAQMLGPRGRLDDLVQDVRLKAVRGFAGFRGESAFTTWLHRIAVNTAISELRRRRSDEALPEDLAGREPPPELAAQRRELRERLAAAVERLPPLLAEAFELRYHLGIDSAEIGRRLEVPPATVRTRLFHARRRLREALDDLLS
jgi:RNA polymerase sigma-70 factor (ECF subfamily)